MKLSLNLYYCFHYFALMHVFSNSFLTYNSFININFFLFDTNLKYINIIKTGIPVFVKQDLLLNRQLFSNYDNGHINDNTDNSPKEIQTYRINTQEETENYNLNCKNLNDEKCAIHTNENQCIKKNNNCITALNKLKNDENGETQSEQTKISDEKIVDNTQVKECTESDKNIIKEKDEGKIMKKNDENVEMCKINMNENSRLEQDMSKNIFDVGLNENVSIEKYTQIDNEILKGMDKKSILVIINEEDENKSFYDEEGDEEDTDELINKHLNEIEKMICDVSSRNNEQNKSINNSESDIADNISNNLDDVNEDEYEFVEGVCELDNINNMYARYKNDLENYRSKLKENKLDEYYNDIIKSRNLININYENEYMLKMKYHKDYNFPLHNLHIVNENYIKNQLYDNIVLLNGENDNINFHEINYYADLSKIDIRPTMFKEFYLKFSLCNGKYLPLGSSFVERVCFLSYHLKKNPHLNKIRITKNKFILYHLFLNVIKAFKLLSINKCVKHIKESNLLYIIFILNEEIIKESENEVNIGKCLNNIIQRNKEWYEILNFIFTIMFGCSSYLKEHYSLTEEEKNNIFFKDNILDLPIFEYFNKNIIDIFVPRNIDPKINIDLFKDVSNSSDKNLKLYQTWYFCYLFIHKVYLLNKMWNIIKKWEASNFVPNPWYIDHIGSVLVPHIISLRHIQQNDQIFFRYIDELQMFVSFKRSKKYSIPNYDKNEFHLVEHVVAFQGTSSPFIWLFNLIYELTPYPFLTKGKVHKAYLYIFKKAVKPYLHILKNKILNEIKNTKSKYSKENPYVIIFTGHSFGAAMANMSSLYLENILRGQGVKTKEGNNDNDHSAYIKIYSITFGMPIFYDDKYFEDFEKSAVISNNINVDYDPIPVTMAIPSLNGFRDPEENKKFNIIFKVEDLKNLNYDFGNIIFDGDELFNNEKNKPRSITFLFMKYFFKDNIFFELCEQHIYQTHYFFYFVFLTLLSRWANEAKWGTYFLIPFFIFDILSLSHKNVMFMLKENYKKYKKLVLKKAQANEKQEKKQVAN
ncbi:lipase, putative [Plasmodium chabaudi adami]|uniref:Lipase, putative n=1 Tax=Plasmodium chabaudi adami TaxID=5826 RepID=A0A1C6XQH3_PLACE|nr:lipase, putative [Plasmodium chabaudi adami]